MTNPDDAPQSAVEMHAARLSAVRAVDPELAEKVEQWMAELREKKPDLAAEQDARLLSYWNRSLSWGEREERRLVEQWERRTAYNAAKAATPNIPYDPKRKRYYLMSKDWGDFPDDVIKGVEFENRNSAFTAVNIEEHRKRGSSTKYHTSDTVQVETPRLTVLNMKSDLLDVYDTDSRRFVASERFKNIITNIDPDGVQTWSAVTKMKNGRDGPPYWILQPTRRLDCVDEERSDIQYTGQAREITNGEMVPTLGYSELNNVFMNEAKVGNAHIFQLLLKTGKIVDEAIVDAYRAAGLKGALFTPLQPRMPQEDREEAGYKNSQYWVMRGYKS
ncbi:imm11 family protein [Pacificimonas sp. ICDLI1SI03]